MNQPVRLLVLPACIVLGAAHGRAADEEAMKLKCQQRAATTLQISAHDVSVKYEGQRVDKTHAVNGSAAVNGQIQAFQCSFARDGVRIAKFILNKAPSCAASPKQQPATQSAAPGKFVATGKVPCAQHGGQPMGQCDFGVSRTGQGSASVTISLARQVIVARLC